MESAQKASRDWEGMPIIVVDKDKCLEIQKKQVEELIEKYNAGEAAQAENIYQKVRNNRQTKSDFCSNIDIEMYKKQVMDKKQETKQEVQKEKSKETKKAEITEADLEENYTQVTAQEREKEVSKIKQILLNVKEITSERKGDETKWREIKKIKMKRK